MNLYALRWRLLAVLVGASVLFAGCDGCSPSKPVNGGQDEDSGIPANELGFTRPLNGRLFQWAGEKDVRNRYAFAVMVKTRAPMAAGVNGECSGVLISPEIVLTAGQCVCIRRKDTAPDAQGRSIIDDAACSATAAVVTVSYESEGGVRTTRTQVYRGDVRPHPNLKILLDEQGNVSSSDADLAVIVLSKPVEGGAVAALAEADVGGGEAVMIVSYGYDEVIGGMDGQRRYKVYKSGRSPPTRSGQVAFEQPDRKLYKGDSGGPVLSVHEGTPQLIGISAAALGEEAAFVSTYFYRDWVVAELQRARSREPPSGDR